MTQKTRIGLNKRLWVVAGVLILAFGDSNSLASFERNGEALILNDRNLEEGLDQHLNVFIMFHSKNCEHCKKFKPKFLELAAELKDRGKELKFGLVDVDANEEAAEIYNVNKIREKKWKKVLFSKFRFFEL